MMFNMQLIRRSYVICQPIIIKLSKIIEWFDLAITIYWPYKIAIAHVNTKMQNPWLTRSSSPEMSQKSAICQCQFQESGDQKPGYQLVEFSKFSGFNRPSRAWSWESFPRSTSPQSCKMPRGYEKTRKKKLVGPQQAWGGWASFFWDFLRWLEFR